MISLCLKQINLNKNKIIEYLNNIIYNVYLIDTLYIVSENRKYILSSSAHGTFIKIDYMLVHMDNLNKSRQNKNNIHNIHFISNEIKLEIKNSENRDSSA